MALVVCSCALAARRQLLAQTVQQQPGVKIGRNASSERDNTVETSIPLWWSFGVRLFLADEQHPKGDVLMF